MNYYIAFYKHNRKANNFKTRLFALFDKIIRLITKSKYSHCEIVTHIYSDTYKCYTSSMRDGGVRVKEMVLFPERWDLIPLPRLNNVDDFYQQTKTCKYDFFGALLVLTPFSIKNNRYFCSEWCAELLNIKNANKISPAKLYEILTTPQK